ncbi:hypothetical protein FHX41_2487 [Actinomadura hallensis]|uniref:Uncharacterized protein n=1 Tax=Actinomadura hallensis TaxID=337895 RepID=A0A543IE06_9ACTN|nr:hypothetical protein FHX41_2487 [Actinomadura hallensis]
MHTSAARRITPPKGRAPPRLRKAARRPRCRLPSPGHRTPSSLGTGYPNSGKPDAREARHARGHGPGAGPAAAASSCSRLATRTNSWRHRYRTPQPTRHRCPQRGRPPGACGARHAPARRRGGLPRRGSEPLPAPYAGPTLGAMATGHQHGTASSGSGERVRTRRHTHAMAPQGVCRHGCGRLLAPRARARVDSWGQRRRVPSSRGDVLPGSGSGARTGPRHARARRRGGWPCRGRGPLPASCGPQRPLARSFPGTELGRRRWPRLAEDAGACTKRGTQESVAVGAGSRRGCGRMPGAAELIDGAGRLVACDGPWRCRCRASSSAPVRQLALDTRCDARRRHAS